MNVYILKNSLAQLKLKEKQQLNHNGTESLEVAQSLWLGPLQLESSIVAVTH